MSRPEQDRFNKLALRTWAREMKEADAVALFAVGVILDGPNKGLAVFKPRDFPRADLIGALERLAESLKEG